jgi:murein DD-endopeptidase MepM/ murein hydrolase activator NlpD
VRFERVGIVGVAVATVIGLTVPTAVAGDDPRNKKRAVDARVRDLRSQVKASTEQVVSASAALADADAKLPGARARLAAAGDALQGAQSAQAVAAARLADTQAKSVRAALAYDQTVAEIHSHHDAVGALARQLYEGGELGRLSLALGAQTPDEFASALAYARSIGRSERATLDRLDAEQRTLAMQRAQLEALREQTAAATDAASVAVDRSRQAATDAATANSDVETLVVARGKALDDAEKLKAAVEKAFAVEEAESARLAKVIAERAAAARRTGHGLPVPLGDGILIFPVIGPITSPFGMRYHPILHRWKLHTGTDFGVPSGTAVHAAADGVVLEVLRNAAYGNRVIVDHGSVDGVYLVTTYNHLSRAAVHKGEHVRRGQVIAYSGDTGWTTGTHLHFEVLVDGRFVDPIGWLRKSRPAA